MTREAGLRALTKSWGTTYYECPNTDASVSYLIRLATQDDTRIEPCAVGQNPDKPWLCLTGPGFPSHF